MHLNPDDEIGDDSPAVTVLSEGIFAALIQAAIRTGTYPQLNRIPEGSAQMTVEDVQQMAELTAENEMLKNTNEMLEGQVDGLKQHIEDTEDRIEEESKTVQASLVETPVSTEPTIHAMDLIANLATEDGKVRSIHSLARG